MNKTDFSRKRKQPFGGMLLFMVNFLKKSLVIEIDSFVNFLNSKSNLSSVKKFTKSAFVQKRMKINPAVFKYHSQVIIENTYPKLLVARGRTLVSITLERKFQQTPYEKVKVFWISIFDNHYWPFYLPKTN